jgi:hypothetical protein
VPDGTRIGDPAKRSSSPRRAIWKAFPTGNRSTASAPPARDPFVNLAKRRSACFQRAIASQKARTDRELREFLRQHYTLLFKKIRSLDPSLESLVKERERAALEPLEDGVAKRAAAVGKK